MLGLARPQALGMELNGRQPWQEMPAGRPQFQPFNYSISTNGNYPQRFSHGGERLVAPTVHCQPCLRVS